MPIRNAAKADLRLWSNATFRRLFLAHALSLSGGMLTSAALALLAYEIVGESVAKAMGIVLTIRIATVVALGPLAGTLADRIGRRTSMVAWDFGRAFVVVGFLFSTELWHIYTLAFLLNAGSALFTPVYKAVIPGIVGKEEYPRALAYGTLAYELAQILGPALAALLIVMVGFRGNFIFDAMTFVVSALLILSVRLPEPAVEKAAKEKRDSLFGIKRMLSVAGLRASLFMSFRTCIVGAFAFVSTIYYVKEILGLEDFLYAVCMAFFGLGSALFALTYGRGGTRLKHIILAASIWMVLGGLALAGSAGGIASVLADAASARNIAFGVLCLGWFVAGGGYSVFIVASNQLLAAYSSEEERAHIYAGHFSLSHAGWGLTYPLAGYLTSAIGFHNTAWVFAGLTLLLSVLVPVRREYREEVTTA